MERLVSELKGRVRDGRVSFVLVQSVEGTIEGERRRDKRWDSLRKEFDLVA